MSEASIGPSAIAHAVRERLSVCQIDDVEAYLALVRASGVELQALIETVVVSETWFFRDPGAFTALATATRETWLPAHPLGTLSVLSLPCSTGEEPYSIVMALLDANVPRDRFRVDAVDISAANIAQGTKAVYGRNSFRSQDLGFRDRYCDPSSEGHRVKDIVRHQVRFQQANMLAADFLPGVGVFDAIFCRNVLIYFDRLTQARALAVLNRLLRADGTLYVAPAETALPPSHGLMSTHEPNAFAFRKAAQAPAVTRRTARPRVPLAPRRSPSQTHDGTNAARTRTMRAATAGIAPATATSPATGTDLEAAARLADQGHFAEAATACEAWLRRGAPSAAAFYLMGLVRDATGNDPEAIGYYRKALYLDPNHYDSQIHLALLMEKQGDAAGAQVLRNRARRLEGKSGVPHD